MRRIIAATAVALAAATGVAAEQRLQPPPDGPAEAAGDAAGAPVPEPDENDAAAPDAQAGARGAKAEAADAPPPDHRAFVDGWRTSVEDWAAVVGGALETAEVAVAGRLEQAWRDVEAGWRDLEAADPGAWTHEKAAFEAAFEGFEKVWSEHLYGPNDET
jgi:hypothetical protein